MKVHMSKKKSTTPPEVQKAKRGIIRMLKDNPPLVELKIQRNAKKQVNFADPIAKAMRQKRDLGVIDFCNERGLSLMMLNRNIKTIYQKKPKRGWAAERRRADPHATYYPPEEMATIAERHVHPRHKRVSA